MDVYMLDLSLKVAYKMNIKEYFKEIEKEVNRNYSAARLAREKGFDPSRDVEVPLANSLAERVVGLVSVLYPQVTDTKIVVRILELEKQIDLFMETIRVK